MGSRGVFASKVRNSKLWWRGPSWLSEPVSSWRKSEVCHQSLTEECITEQKKSLAGKVVSETVLLVANQPDPVFRSLTLVAGTSCSVLLP